MRVQLSDHFTYGKLFRFVLPSMLMMVFTSMYGMVDGLFVSNFVGKVSFAAINLIMPVAMGMSVIGFMLGTGGSAIVSKTMGEGKQELANKYFSMIVYCAVAGGILLSVIGFIFTDKICILLGAEAELLRECVIYGRIMFLTLWCFIMQIMFQSFFVAAEKPNLSFRMSVISGVINIILDYLLIVEFEMGIAGAAIATGVGELIGGIVPLVYFARKNDSRLRLVKCRFYGGVLLKTCTNGASEMVTNLSSSIVNIIYNYQLMRVAGDDGVAAYGIVMYVNFAFMAILIGYSVGSAPITGYHYGADNYDELKNMFRKGITIMVSAGTVLMVMAEIFAEPVVNIFVNYDRELCSMTVKGFRIFAVAFVAMGINVWTSSFFTSLNNGKVSAVISFMRTFLFQIIMVLVLPFLFGINGIWSSIVVAEVLALIISFAAIVMNRREYHYI